MTLKDIASALARGSQVTDAHGDALVLEDGIVKYKVYDSAVDESDIEHYQPYLFDGLEYPDWLDAIDSEEVEAKLRDLSEGSFTINVTTVREANMVCRKLKAMGFTGTKGHNVRSIWVQYDGTFQGYPIRIRRANAYLDALDRIEEWELRARKIMEQRFPVPGDKYFTVSPTATLDGFEIHSRICTERDNLKDSSLVFKEEIDARKMVVRLNYALQTNPTIQLTEQRHAGSVAGL